ncbi:MAG: sulfatase-like hydrolase/transferase [Planctomycetota bacterium]|nr:sulfatase-like hydrolase/transferase [Planctomycetota bacterium]
MNLRHFALLTLIFCSCKQESSAPPNILFLYSDDHASAAVSAYSKTLTHTPNIDRLAAEGMKFTQAFCTNAICGPARAVVLTGKHSHINGFLDNTDQFNGDQPTFPKMLQAEGYETAVIGKWHLKSEPKGFDHWDILPGQGRYYAPEFLTAEGKKSFPGYNTDITADKAMEWLAHGRDSEKPFLLMCQFKAPHRPWMPGPQEIGLYGDDVIPEPATLFDDASGLGTAAKEQEMSIAEHMWLWYDLKVPVNEDHLEGPDRWTPGRLDRLSAEEREAWKNYYDASNAAFRENAPQGDALTQWKYQRYIKDYLRCIQGIDRNVGRILDQLETLGLADNTLVVYTSDQGFFLGEHGWYDKRFMYEPSLKVPFLVRWPSHVPAGSINEDLVQNLDFAPTFLDLAGIDAPEDMQGDSLKQLLQQKQNKTWRSAVYYEYSGEATHHVAAHYGVRTKRYKLIYYPDLQEWELFDLQKDPEEIRSVAHHADYAEIQNHLQENLVQLRKQYEVEEPLVFQDAWRSSPNRPWPGKDWHANRTQDWQVKNGWLECLTGQNGPAGRTVNLLTQVIEEGEESIHLEVTVRPTNYVGTLRDGASFGFLFGMGGENIDYRATALVQQAPAPGGGLLVCMDSDGKLSLRDFSESLNKAGYWTIPGGVDSRNLRELAAAKERFPLGAYAVRLKLHWKNNTLTLKAKAQVTGNQLAGKGGAETSLVIHDFSREKLQGSISLFSARGTKESKNGFAFGEFQLTGATPHPERAWGPILGVLYTTVTDQTGEHALRMTVQHPILHAEERPQLKLVINENQDFPGEYQTNGSYTTQFQTPFPRLTRSLPYALYLNHEKVYEGILRKEPGEQDTATLGLLSCLKNQVGPLSWNADGLWFPHNDVAQGIQTQDPDLLYFAGDQIYEGDITGVDSRSEHHQILDYHTKWQRFLWSFGDLTKNRPTICIPDDHDVFHGNLWGAGGRRAQKTEEYSTQDSGGYKMSAKFVNAVHGTLVSHLPPSQVSPTIGQGISTYTTSFSWGGIDFCVLSDRMWKDSPSVAVPALNFKNGWPQADVFSPDDADVFGAQLLGKEQEDFLEAWAQQKTGGTWTKVVLSQSPFACLHTLPGIHKGDQVVGRLPAPKPGEYPENDVPVVDGDSNGWPQSARNRAVKSLKKAGALHLVGDQHLGSVAWYGSDKHRDGTVVFTGPALGNTWPRRWMPAEKGANQIPGAPRYTGDYLDGFGNKITMLAVANPADLGRKPKLLYDRSPGFGIVHFNPKNKETILEAWPRWQSSSEEPKMFPGWPIHLNAQGMPISPVKK